MENKATWLAIIVAILTVFISPFYNQIGEHFFPKENLSFEIKQIVEIENLKAFEILIENNGSNSEKNIKIELEGNIYEKNPINAYDSTREIKIIANKNSYVVEIGDLKSKEIFSATFLLEDASIRNLFGEARSIKVYSEERMANQIFEDTFSKEFYKTMFWMSIITIIAFVIVGITYDTATSPEKHIDYHKRQIDKYKKKVRNK